MMNERKIEGFLLALFVAGVILTLGVLAYKTCHKQEIISTSQEFAETVEGVTIAGDKAGAKLDKSQAYEVAEVIKAVRLENTAPAYEIKTTGKDVKKESQLAKENAKADFSIVVNKDKPEEKVSLDDIDNDKSVILQQYNVKAYKKVIRTIDYSTNKQATFTISRKVSDSGSYIGIGAGYDWENNRIIGKVSFSW